MHVGAGCNRPIRARNAVSIPSSAYIPPLLQLSLPLSPWRDGSVESVRSGPGGQDRQEAPGEGRESISDLRKHESALQKHYKLEWVASSQEGH